MRGWNDCPRCGGSGSGEGQRVCGYAPTTEEARGLEVRTVDGEFVAVPAAEKLELDPLNRFAVTAKDGTVLIMLGPVPRLLQPETALELAAWLIVGAELAGVEDSEARVVELVRVIRDM